MEPKSRRGRSAPVEACVQQSGIDVYEVVFQKGEHQWRFRYMGGEEPAMIEAVRDIMRQGSTGDETGGGSLDWVDLALIAHEIRSGPAIEIVRKKEGIL
jgi:hypothetical protein